MRYQGECLYSNSGKGVWLTAPRYSLMMCMKKNDLYAKAKWDGAEGSSRQVLLDDLQGEILLLSFDHRDRSSSHLGLQSFCLPE